MILISKKLFLNAVITPAGEIVDKNSGEVINKFGVFIADELLRRKRRFQQELERQKIGSQKIGSQKLLSKNKHLLNIIDEAGIQVCENKIHSDFIWAYFQNQQDMFPDLKHPDISRLLYLSTYCEYNTNKLVNDDGTPIHKKDLRKIMNLNRCVFNPWLEKMVEKKYVLFRNDKIYINKGYIKRGNLVQKGNTKAMRLFIDMIRELYLGLKADDHHKMGLVIRLIPYINPHLNCLSKNLCEKDKKKLIPLRLGELADKLGYSKRQCRNLENEILRIRIGEERKRIAIAVALDDPKPENPILMFNSKLFFGGNTEGYELVNSIFDNYESREPAKLDI